MFLGHPTLKHMCYPYSDLHPHIDYLTMELISQAELAQRAAQDVAVVAAQLQEKWRNSWSSFYNRQDKIKIKNLVTLATSLQYASSNLDKDEQEEHKDQQDDVAGLEVFLWGLELVCTVCDPL